jgi:Ca-activated chloride channel family protein
MHFASPRLLWLLALLPLLFFVRGRRGGAAAVRYPSTAVVREVGRAARARFGWVPQVLRVAGLALLVVGLARPQVVHAHQRVEASGVDLMLAVDVSGSMEALDMQRGGAPESRVDAVKDVVARFVAARPNDRIGLVAFAGGPYLVSPLTLDHDWLARNLARLRTGLVEDGTAIGSALATSVNRLRASDAKSKVVVLLTDGVNNAGSVQPRVAAEAARALGVRVYTIGVGSTGRAPVPVRADDGTTRVVMADVDIDEASLQSIADTTGGRYFRATDTESLARVYAAIDALERTPRTIERFEQRQERFAGFVGPGLLLLAFEVLLRATLFRRIP